MNFIEHLDREFEEAVREVNRNIQDIQAASNARRGLFSTFRKKLGKYKAKRKRSKNKGVF